MNTITGALFNKPVKGEDGNTHVLDLQGASNTTYQGCTFDGDNVKMDKGSTIVFDGCTFKNAKRTSGNHQGIYCGSCSNLIIQNCTFEDCTQWAQIYNAPGLIVRSNTVLRVGYGLKASLGSNAGTGWIFSGNIIKRCRAMGIELQYDATGFSGLQFIGNSYDEAERYDNDALNNGATMAFSLPFVPAAGVVIQNNYADGLSWILNADGSPLMSNGVQVQRASGGSWLGVRIGMECGGVGTKLDNNWFRRMNRAVSRVPGWTGTWINQPNLVQSCLEPASDQNTPGTAWAGNDANQVLTGTGGWTLVGVTPPGGSPPPPPPPPPVITPPVETWTDLPFQVSNQGNYRVKP